MSSVFESAPDEKPVKLEQKQSFPDVLMMDSEPGFLTSSFSLDLCSSSSVSQVVQQQQAECSQKLQGLSTWLAGAAGLLASQRPGAESGDVDVLQEQQRKLKV